MSSGIAGVLWASAIGAGAVVGIAVFGPDALGDETDAAGAAPPVDLRLECEAGWCSARLFGRGDADTPAVAPLPYRIAAHDPDGAPPEPEPIAPAAAHAEAGADYGWRFGAEESEVAVYVTPVGRDPRRPEAFIIEQRGGFEVIRQTHLVVTVEADGRLREHLRKEDGAGLPFVSSLASMPGGFVHTNGPVAHDAYADLPTRVTRYHWSQSSDGWFLIELQ